MPQRPDPFPELSLRIGHLNSVLVLVFSPDGRTLASAAWDGTVKLWDPWSGELIRTLAPGWSSANALAFSPDGAVLAAIGNVQEDHEGLGPCEVRLWDVESGKSSRALRGPWPVALDFLPDGGLLLLEEGEVKLWDPRGRAEAQPVASFQEKSSFSSFSRVGERLAAAGYGDVIALFHWKSGACLWRVEAPQMSVASLSPDGSLVAGGGGCGDYPYGILKLRDAGTGEERSVITGQFDRVMSLSFAPDGSSLAAGCHDGMVVRADPSSGALRWTHVAHHGWVRTVAFSPDGKVLASAGDDSRIVLTDAETGSRLRHLGGRRNGVLCLDVSHDGERIAGGYEDGRVRIWNARTGELETIYRAHPERVRSLSLSPDGAEVVTAGAEGSARLWQTKTGTLERIFQVEEGMAEVRAVAFSPLGRRVACLAPVRGTHERQQGGLFLWDTRTGRSTNLVAPDAESDPPSSSGFRGGEKVTWSPDGRTIAVLSFTQVQLLDAGTGAVLRVVAKSLLDRLCDRGSSLAFSHDGKTLAVGYEGFDVILWDVGTGKESRSFSAPRDNAWSMAFSPDARALAVATSYELWGTLLDCQTGYSTFRFVHRAAVAAVAFSPDGGTLVSGGMDGIIKTWDLKDLKAGGWTRVFLAITAGDGERAAPEWIAFSSGARTRFSDGAAPFLKDPASL